jgi:hypothetical protein
MEAGAETVRVKHGAWVETSREFFVEGAWEGEFEQGGLHETLLLIGSGGRLAPNRVIFATPGHTLERLQLVQIGREISASAAT